MELPLKLRTLKETIFWPRILFLYRFKDNKKAEWCKYSYSRWLKFNSLIDNLFNKTYALGN